MGRAYQREVAEYAAMDADHFAHVLATSRAFVAGLREKLSAGEDHPAPDRELLLTAGRRRQQDGISLDAAMHAFRIASRVAWTAFADAATAKDPHLVGALAGRWIDYVDRAATAFAEGHATAATDELRRVDARRQAVVADLLTAGDGIAARAVAAQYGLRLAGVYLPVLVLDGFAAVDVVAAALPADALVGHRGDRVVALVPDPTDALDLTPLAHDRLVARGRPAAPGAELLTEIAALESTLATARVVGRTAGVVDAADLVIDRVVREHPDLRDHLEESVLLPLAAGDPDGVFRATLRAFAASGSVPEVATALFVHPNTVTYRLRRVRDLTGLDVRVPAEAAVLVLAVALEGGMP
jgi:hypothetical protein